ncbi:MAG: DUF393 domain-containing protein [Marinilabiliaceae bacterium]|nr:DUF393 domain-containing protein [Marinilabiliaceae bacterium]
MMADQLIVVFDGGCNMCSMLVRWLSVLNKRDRFVFVSQQSYIDQFPDQKDTIDRLHLNDELVVWSHGVAFFGAGGVLLILQALGGGYILLKFFIQLFPRILLDRIYTWVAHHRYQFMGRRKSCHIRPPLP